MDRFQDISKVRNPAASKAKVSSNYLEPSKENVLGKYDAVILILHHLKVLHDMVLKNYYINFSDAAIIS